LLDYLTDVVPRSDAAELVRIRFELINGVKEKIGAGGMSLSQAAVAA